MEVSEFNKWLKPFTKIDGKLARLICFHHAGSTPLVFRSWHRVLDHTQVIAVSLPGRAFRRNEPPAEKLDEICEGIVEELQLITDIPYLFFGHSMGALLAFEVARHLRQSGLRLPEKLIVSGHRAPQLPRRLEQIHDLPDAALIEELRGLEGTPEELLVRPEMIGALLPILRSDLKLAETYQYHAEPPLDIPIIASRGSRDSFVSNEELTAWESQSTIGCQTLEFLGGHFYFSENSDILLARLYTELLLNV